MSNVRLATVLAASLGAACDSVPLVAPTESTVQLVVADTSLPNGASTSVTAAVTELGGTPVHDGTVVTFTATLGVIHPPEAPTVRGQARATFTAGDESGAASLRAYSGNAVSEEVEVTIGAAAVASVLLAAEPASLPPTGGKTRLVATALDGGRNPLPDVAVAFRATAGALRDRVVTTDRAGEARTELETTAAAEVTASVGGLQATAAITIDPATAISVTATPEQPAAGQPVSFEVTLTNEARAIRRAAIAFGDGGRRDLGAVTHATVTHTYRTAGAYTATVRATDAAGHVATSSVAVQVRPAPSIPVTITASPLEVVAGDPVSFTVEVSPSSDAPAVRDVTIDFGDRSTMALGALAGRRSVAHVYERDGSYIASATARDAAGRRHTASVGVQVRPAPSIPVTVAASPADPVAGQPVTFTVEVSPPAGAPAVRDATVDFGDRSTMALGALTGRRSVAHAYERPGSYAVTVTVRDTGGGRHTASIGVTVRSAPGIPVTVAASPADPVAGQPVTFTVEVSPPAGAPAVRDATIDFGDRATMALGALAGRRSVAHAYERPGSYVVTVTVRDAAGRRHESSIGVTVRPAPGIPISITASPVQPVVGQPVTFAVEVSPPAGAPAVRDVTIDFGDATSTSLGALAGRRSVAHVYRSEGSYVVTVTAHDTAGRRHESSIGIVVADE